MCRRRRPLSLINGRRGQPRFFFRRNSRTSRRHPRGRSAHSEVLVAGSPSRVAENTRESGAAYHKERDITRIRACARVSAIARDFNLIARNASVL